MKSWELRYFMWTEIFISWIYLLLKQSSLKKVVNPCLFCQGTNVLINQGVQQSQVCLKNACSENMLLSITNREFKHALAFWSIAQFSMPWRGIVMLPEKISPLYSGSISGNTLESGRDYCSWLLVVKFIAGLLFSVKSAISSFLFLPDCFIS